MPLLRHPSPDPFFADVPFHPVTFVIDAGGNGVYGVRLEFTGGELLWADIQQAGRFGCRADICGPIFGGAFRLDRPLLFTVELVPQQAQILAALAEGPHKAHEVLEQAPAGSALRRSESWRLLSVMQQHTPRVQWGLTTTWLHESGR
ncbi:MAG: hypothetical protein V4850_04435 [Myxococcota bacterium]